MTDAPRILIVDDEGAIRFFLSEELSQAGYVVSTAASGEEALVRLRQETIDLILLDLQMDGMDGLQVMQEVERQPLPPEVIVLTAHASLDSAVDAMRLGGSDYLQKPCATKDLLSSVEKAVAKHRKALQHHSMVRLIEHTARQLQATAPPEAKVTAPSRPALLEARGLLLNLEQETATRRGELLSLTPTEFHMLVYLTERLDQVVGYQELAAAVHGAESGEWESWEARQTLATHMWRLRRKLGDGPDGHPYVVNVRGRGYRFIRRP